MRAWVIFIFPSSKERKLKGNSEYNQNDRKKKQSLIIVLGDSIIFSRIRSEVSENDFQ